jgi:ElaB/YqjD/DUF883 family membrane-anchored ribosome-binding protein
LQKIPAAPQANGNVLPLYCVTKRNLTEVGPITMTSTERSTYPPSSKPYGSGGAPAAGVPKDDLASKGAEVFRDAKAGVESMISDAGDYAGKKGKEAMDNMRGVGDTVAVAIERSVTTRPYTTLALAVAAGFLFGATWRR